MKKKTLMILAGYPASGKTTLLSEAANARVPLFGPEFASEFEDAVASGALAERLPTYLKLEQRTWITSRDLVHLENIEVLPESIAFHFDLLLHLHRNLESLTDDFVTEATLKGVFKQFLIGDFCRRFDTVVAHTLVPDFSIVAANWRKRKQDVSRSRHPAIHAKDHLITGIARPEETYRAVSRSWLRAVAENATASLVSHLDQAGVWRTTRAPVRPRTHGPRIAIDSAR